MVALSAFVAVVVVDPGDHIFHLKLPLLLLVLSLWATRVIFGLTKPCSPKLWAGVLLFALIIPGIGTIIGLLGSSLPPGELTFEQTKAFAILVILPVLVSERINLTTHIVAWSSIVAASTLTLLFLLFANPLLFSVLSDFAVKNDNAFVSTRDVVGLGIGSIYYKTVSLLLFPIAVYLRNLSDRPQKLISATLAGIFLAAILCTDNRALVLAAFGIVAFFIFRKLRETFGSVLALSFLMLMLSIPGGYFTTYFRLGESSNSVKIGHIHSYAMEFEEHPKYLLWGQGVGTEFYSQGFQAKTTLTELTYLDLVRWFGLPVSVLILITVFYPIVGLVRAANDASYLALPYAAYVCAAATDPLLICSFGALVVSAIWGVLLTCPVQTSF